jgi:hypothetical protein
MNAYLHRSENRGHVKAGWLDTYHSFHLVAGTTRNTWV